MRAADHDQFWTMYNDRARPRIEACCRKLSRELTDHTMDPDDMIAWADDRVWRLLVKGGWPTFHDDPTPEQAIDRLCRNALVLSRWAYLALSRKHWRRASRAQAYVNGLSQAERMAMVKAAPTGLEQREQIAADLDRVRAILDEPTKRKLAASWPEESERRRIAMALEATDEQTRELIDETTGGEMKPNTVQQMRSRIRKQIRTIVDQVPRSGLALALIASAVVLTLTATAQAGPSMAREGEQTGGRKGMVLAGLDSVGQDSAGQNAGLNPLICGEQTGGRKKK